MEITFATALAEIRRRLTDVWCDACRAFTPLSIGPRAGLVCSKCGAHPENVPVLVPSTV